MKYMRNNSYAISERIRIGLDFLWILSLLAVLLSVSVPLLVVLITGIIAGVYTFFAALYFKKTPGPGGVLAGSNKYAYLYSGFLFSLIIIGFSAYLTKSLIGINSTNLTIIFLTVLFAGWAIIYLVIRRNRTKRKV